MAPVPIHTRFSQSLRWLGAGFLTAAASAGLLIIRADASTAGVVYLVLVVWFATIAGRGIAFWLAVLSALQFDYFFLAPRFRFALSGLQSWLGMLAFVVACVIVSRVAERARKQTHQADQRREDVERLYALNQEMMLHGDSNDLVHKIPLLVEKGFGLQSVLLHLRAEDQVYSSIPDVPSSIIEEMRTGSSSVDQELKLSEGFTSINLMFGMSCAGTLAWKPDILSREVAASVATQIAIVITRWHAVEASSRLEAARSADKLRQALIDSLTHELRTPLTAIRAAATTLLDGYGLDDASRLDLASIVEEESARLDSLIGEAMEIAEIEADGIRVNPVPVRITNFLEQAVEQSHAQLATHQVTVDAIDGEAAWFDPHLTGRVLRHLLENAAQHTPIGTRIRLSGRISQGRISFEVRDEGPGISARDLPHIFEKFYRGRKKGRNSKGSGMGLAIVRALLAAHGGAVEATSTPGEGTTFRLWVPMPEKSERVAADADVTDAQQAL